MNNMSNYNLKAKNKQTGEIVDFTAMDYGYTYRYIENIKNRVFLPDGTLENPEYSKGYDQAIDDIINIIKK